VEKISERRQNFPHVYLSSEASTESPPMFEMIFQYKSCATFSISGLFDLMTLNTCHMLHSALGWFSPSLKSVNYPFITYNVFTADTLRYPVTLTFGTLTLNVCSVSVIKLGTKFERNQTIRGGVIAISLCPIRSILHHVFLGVG